jgi:hypothetical protein
MTARPRRPPRDNEISLLLSLATGPRPLTIGPVGRCTKRGWCRRHLPDPPDANTATVTYELTEKGWSELVRLEALSIIMRSDSVRQPAQHRHPGNSSSCV